MSEIQTKLCLAWFIARDTVPHTTAHRYSSEHFTPSDLKAIAKEMKRIIKWNQPLVRQELPRPEMLTEIEKLNEPYKIELLAAIPEGQNISRYFIGDPEKFEKQPWWDLCAGPHLDATGDINPDAFALESIAGAYWRGDEKNPMLQRIYGTAWENPEQLLAYHQMLEEAKRRDHRLIRGLGAHAIHKAAVDGPTLAHKRQSTIATPGWQQRWLENFTDKVSFAESVVLSTVNILANISGNVLFFCLEKLLSSPKNYACSL